MATRKSALRKKLESMRVGGVIITRLPKVHVASTIQNCQRTSAKCWTYRTLGNQRYILRTR